MKKMLQIFGFIVLAIIVLAIFNSVLNKDSATDKPADTTKQEVEAPVKEQPAKEKSVKKEAPKTNPGISKSEFDQIKSGMTYEEVVAIIGGSGEVLSESGSAGEAYHTVMYEWDGEKGIGSNANLMFQENKLANKAQFGLK